MNFEGRVYFEPLITQVKSKRKFVRRKAGKVLHQATSMNRKKFNEVIINVLKSAVLKLPSVKNFRIIADEAGGHSFG